MKLSHDTVSEGLVIFADERDKIAVVTVNHHQGLVRNGIPVYEKMPKSSWTVHWTSPIFHLDLIRAVVNYIDSLPE